MKMRQLLSPMLACVQLRLVDYCDEHKLRKLTGFCLSCEARFCKVCKYKYHLRHEIARPRHDDHRVKAIISKQLDEKLESIAQKQAKIARQIEKANELQRFLSEKDDKKDENRHKLKTKLMEEFENEVAKHEKTINKELDSAKKQYDKIKVESDELGNVLNEARSFINAEAPVDENESKKVWEILEKTNKSLNGSTNGSSFKLRNKSLKELAHQFLNSVTEAN
jgi:hypothetical protein